MYSFLKTSMVCLSSMCTSYSFMGGIDSHNGFFDAYFSLMFGTAAYIILFLPIGLMIIAACCGTGYFLYFAHQNILREFPHLSNDRFTWSLIYGGVTSVMALFLSILFINGIGAHYLHGDSIEMIASIVLACFLVGFSLPTLYLIHLKFKKK